MPCPGLTLKHGYILIALSLVSMVFAAGCTSQSEPLTEESLKNAAYKGIYPEALVLTAGRYEGEPFVEGGASRPQVTLIEPYAFGDLNGDGMDDAAVLLVENSGGSGSFVYLAAVLNQDGKPVNKATRLLGDRVQIQALRIESGQIRVETLTHAPNDPLCCPSQESISTFNLEESELAPHGN
jgi:hypothetical protein